jgi:enamine deaminase RidA (YjgF/YER057c/UK114 family)
MSCAMDHSGSEAVVTGADRVAWRLPATPGNVHWGYFDQSLARALTVPSGAACGAYAHATAHGTTLYVTGQLPVDPDSGLPVDGDVVVQASRVMANLARFWSSSEPLLNRPSWPGRFFESRGTSPPSRTTVVVSGFAIEGDLVEIDLVAGLGT